MLLCLKQYHLDNNLLGLWTSTLGRLDGKGVQRDSPSPLLLSICSHISRRGMPLHQAQCVPESHWEVRSEGKKNQCETILWQTMKGYRDQDTPPLFLGFKSRRELSRKKTVALSMGVRRAIGWSNNYSKRCRYKLRSAVQDSWTGFEVDDYLGLYHEQRFLPRSKRHRNFELIFKCYVPWDKWEHPPSLGCQLCGLLLSVSLPTPTPLPLWIFNSLAPEDKCWRDSLQLEEWNTEAKGNV